MIGSVSASKSRGIPPSNPARNGSLPNPVTRKYMNTPNAAGNRLLVRLPEPYAIFWLQLNFRADADATGTVAVVLFILFYYDCLDSFFSNRK